MLPWIIAALVFFLISMSAELPVLAVILGAGLIIYGHRRSISDSTSGYERTVDSQSVRDFVHELNVIDNANRQLIRAIAGGATLEYLRALVKSGANLNIREEESAWTPLMLMVISGPPGPEYNAEDIRGLIGLGANVNARGNSGESALTLAVMRNGYLTHERERLQRIVVALLDGLAREGNQREHVQDALEMAAFSNIDEEIVRLLLDAGALPGPVALTNAAAANTNPKILQMLIAAGAEVNARSQAGKTALMVAAEGNTNPEVIEVLLDNGAQTEIRDDQGKSATDYFESAPHWHNHEAFETLKSRLRGRSQ